MTDTHLFFSIMHVLSVSVIVFAFVFLFVAASIPHVAGLSKRKKPTRNPFTGEMLKEEIPPKAVVVITGASTGIGRDAAIEFAKNPLYKVYATMRNINAADFTADEA